MNTSILGPLLNLLCHPSSFLTNELCKILAHVHYVIFMRIRFLNFENYTLTSILLITYIIPLAASS